MKYECLRDAAQRQCFLELVGDGPGDALGAVGVGGRRHCDTAQRGFLAGSRVRELAMRSASAKSEAAWPGSVAAAACAISISAKAFGFSSVRELAMPPASARSRVARPGSVTTSPKTVSVHVFNILASSASPAASKPPLPYARPRRSVTSAVLSHLLAPPAPANGTRIRLSSNVAARALAISCGYKHSPVKEQVL
jgi:hypothetical protein